MSGDFDQDYTETWKQFKDRLHKSLREVAKAIWPGQNAIVFTSGGPISLLAQAYLGVPEHDLMKMNRTLVNCGVTKLVVSNSGIFVGTLNEHSAFENPPHNHLVTYT